MKINIKKEENDNVKNNLSCVVDKRNNNYKSNENDTFAYDYIEKFSPEALSNLCVAFNLSDIF